MTRCYGCKFALNFNLTCIPGNLNAQCFHLQTWKRSTLEVKEETAMAKARKGRKKEKMKSF